MRKASSRRAALALFAWLLQFPTLVPAVPIHVPDDAQTIQQAIEFASPGDEIIVAPGAYHEQIDFKGKAITVRSAAGPSETIIEGSHDGTLVNMESGEGRDSILQGFTLRGGNAGFGGALYLRLSSPTIVDNIFEDNNGTGAAVYVNGGAPRIARNIFRSHRLCASVVYLVNFTDVEFVGNVLADNNCEAIYMYITEFNTPLIANNTFVRNEAGIMFVSAYSARKQVLRNNLLYGNVRGFVHHPLTSNPGPPQWRHNLVYGNGTNYDSDSDSEPARDWTGMDGNISIDPLLGGLDLGDYHPDTESPAIDAGEIGYADDRFDVYREPRIHDGNGDGIEATDIGAAELNFPTPVVTLAAEPTQIPLGGTTTLTWSATSADACEALGVPWSGSRTPSGSEPWSSAEPGRPVFQIVCRGPGGKRGRAIELIVGDVFPVSIAVTPDRIADNQSATLTWSVPDATSCEASGAWGGPVPVSGSRTVQHPYILGAHEYKLYCKSGAGTGRGSAMVTVHPRPTVDLSLVADGPIYPGSSFTLAWRSENADSCTASGSWSGELPVSGSKVVTAPAQPGVYTYRITCHGPTNSDDFTGDIYVAPLPDSGAQGAGGGRMPWGLALMALPALWRRVQITRRRGTCR